MKFNLFIFIITIAFSSPSVWAWGERGHHIVGYTAAHIFNKQLTTEEQTLVGDFFSQRKIAMGHLNNIPDIQWKDSRYPEIAKKNRPTHYFDVEHIVGPRTIDNNNAATDFRTRILSIEPDFQKFLKKHHEQKSFSTPNMTVDIYNHVGTAPYRIKQLYKIMVSAFACAKQKESNPDHNKKKFVEPFTNGEYLCTQNSPRTTDFAAAVMIGGVLGHFVADLSQPYHTTIDFDGLHSGQGGVHSYYETVMVHLMDEKLTDDIVATATQHWSKKYPNANSQQIFKHAKKIAGLTPIEPTNNTPFDPFQVALQIIAQAQDKLTALSELDRKYAVIKIGDTLNPMQNNLERSPTSIPLKNADRKPADNPIVLKNFRAFTIERLSSAAVILSQYWVAAWREAGSPNLTSIEPYSIPYPLQVPFINTP